MRNIAQLMKFFHAAAIAMTMAAWNSAFAADKTGEFTVLSFGNRSCAQVIADFEEDGNRRLANSTWVAGYLTAINKFVFKGKDISNGTDSDGRMLWIINHCKANPLDTLERATSALVTELRKRVQ